MFYRILCFLTADRRVPSPNFGNDIKTRRVDQQLQSPDAMTGPVPTPPPAQSRSLLQQLCECCFGSPAPAQPQPQPQQQFQQPQQFYPAQPAPVLVPASAEFQSRPLFFPPSSSLQPLLSLIGTARSSIDLSIFSLTSDALSNPLLAAHKRGIRLRIVTDPDQAEEGKDRGNDVERMEQAGVPCVRTAGLKSGDGRDRKALMHNKYLVVDGRTVATGRWVELSRPSGRARHRAFTRDVCRNTA